MRVAFNTPNYNNLIGFGSQNSRKIISDIVTPRHVDIVQVENSNYYMCPGSESLSNYRNIAKFVNPERGLSLNPGHGGEWAKGGFDTPLGVSNVGNGAVLALYNTEKGTHAIFQPGPVKRDAEYLKRCISLLMPEGFTEVTIIPGCHPDTCYPVCNLIDAVKGINNKAICNFKHVCQKLSQNETVEIVSYKGNVCGAVEELGKTLFRKVDSLKNTNLLYKAWRV